VGGDGIPTRLVIPSVGIDSKVIQVGWQMVEQNSQLFSIWQVADYAVGWHETSARLGQVGNTVMAGHHNVNGEVFRDLVNVEVGDKVEVYSGDQKFEYVIELKTIVKEKGEPIEVRQRNAQWIAATTDQRLTMVTCWPYTNNTHRVIVVAKPL
jgi:sortase A